MLKIILFFILVCAATFSLLWLFENDGSAVFEWFGYAVEIRTSALVIFLIIGFFILYILFGIIFKIIGLPSLFSRYNKERLEKRDFKLVETSIISILSGNNEEAKKSIQKLVEDNKKSKTDKYGKLTDALSARLAYSEGNLVEAEYKYKNLLSSKDTEFFAVKGLFDAAFLEGDMAKAIGLAEKAYKLNPKIENGAHSLLELYKKAGKWDDALGFIDNYKRAHRFSEDKYNDIDTDKEYAFLWYKKGAEIFDKYGSKPALVESAYNHLVKALKKRPFEKEYVLKAIEIFEAYEKPTKIQAVVEKFWSSEQNQEVGIAYLKTIEDDKAENELKKRTKALDRLDKINKNTIVSNSLKDFIIGNRNNEIA